jgi:putative sterol carrier protein
MWRRHYAATVVKFLTDEWVSALHRSAATHDVAVDATFAVEYRVDVDDAEPFVYQIRFESGSITATLGSAIRPDVVLSTDRTTACRIATNELSAQLAFMAGQVRVDGDAMALVRNHDALAQLEQIFTDVRAQTEY